MTAGAIVISPAFGLLEHKTASLKANLRLFKTAKARIEGGSKLMEIKFLGNLTTVTALGSYEPTLIAALKAKIGQPVSQL